MSLIEYIYICVYYVNLTMGLYTSHYSKIIDCIIINSNHNIYNIDTM